MKGCVHSIQSLGTVDGPGVRSVVFTSGCPLRCIYCHNPDTWHRCESDMREASEVAEQILRFYPYIKNGGVTFSGGEPCVEAEFLCELAGLLKARGLHIALDTSGAIDDQSVERLLEYIDLVLLDVKFTDEESYRRYTGGSLKQTISFLDKLSERKIPVTIRHVVVPGINDSEDDVVRLAHLVAGYKNVTAIELLPYKNLCIEKYESLGIDFSLADTLPLGATRLSELNKALSDALSDAKTADF